MSTNGWDAAKDAARAATGTVSPEIREALNEYLDEAGDSGYERDRLHYGADLYPGACERKTWYGLHGAKADPETLGSKIRFWGGRLAEDLVVQALSRKNLVATKQIGAKTHLETQVLVRPLRPSSWAWSPGRADLLLVNRKLLEIKAPRAWLFEAAKGDPTRLVKEQYRYQLSAYFHELRARGKCDRAAFLFLDREGSHEPVEVPLQGELLIPLEKIVEEERRKADLILRKDAPERIAGELVVRVWKGQDRSKPRPMEAVVERSWQCSYCRYASTCQPAPEEQHVAIKRRDAKAAVEEAERRWNAGARATPQVIKLGSLPIAPVETAREPKEAIQPDIAAAVDKLPAAKDAEW